MAQSLAQHALDLAMQAVATRPDSAESHKNLATALKDRGRFDEAIAACHNAIALKSDYPEAYQCLGNVFRNQGKFDDAAAAYRAAIALRSNYAEAYNNLGSVLQSQRNLDEALSAHRRAVEIKPDLAVAYVQIARVLRDMGKLDEALAACSMGVDLMPAASDFHTRRGAILLEMGRVPEAIEACRRGVELAPARANAHRVLSHAMIKAGDRLQAIESLREALRLDPNSQQIAFELAALSGDGSAPAAPATFVRELFDRYSNAFDAHLVNALHYRGPEQLRSAMETVTDRKDLAILDLGCGTGLCGEQLRPMAHRLAGVDLSPAMLERCAKRKIYDELIEGDITDVLLRTPEQWDLIVAGDVLVYIGDLTAVLSAASAALRPGGWIAFTMERHSGPGFFLRSSFRYAHSIQYIRALAVRSNLEEVVAREATIRFQSKVPVPGWIVVLRKPAAAASALGEA
jgi:predicted TPR repeat methyltransferase